MNTDMGNEIGWEDEIEKDSPDFITLPEGDYDFVITDFERARHAGSEKLPPCNKAVVHIKIETPEGISTIKHNLFLHTITEGMLSAFFTGIGQKKKGERVTMNWNLVVGSTGRCKLGIRKWKTDDGEERSSNEIKRFYEPTETSTPQQQTFEPGRF
ncbi:DUF669 domain-containing protein [Alkalibaculum sp. M08DMB]|uniref:DUF669 domain-containing protein n=1 Tax=Alkalibaculum sporogenes TaxID=2655001 RepID=A0A6A7K9A2_9FIRM|nr:DUF669 domain-containing protein [Alkalibaculum sporogenes]MPW25972.1 DUF669 domain-containing protein [Alkalibaculum sporogenes]